MLQEHFKLCPTHSMPDIDMTALLDSHKHFLAVGTLHSIAIPFSVLL